MKLYENLDFLDTLFFENVTSFCPVCNFGTSYDDMIQCAYCKVASFNTSHLEAHVGFFRLLMKGIFGPYSTVTF